MLIITVLCGYCANCVSYTVVSVDGDSDSTRSRNNNLGFEEIRFCQRRNNHYATIWGLKINQDSKSIISCPIFYITYLLKRNIKLIFIIFVIDAMHLLMM